MEYFGNNFTAPLNSDKIVMWRFLRNRRLILCLHAYSFHRAPTYWAHRAVILAIAWFPCLFAVLFMMMNQITSHS